MSDGDALLKAILLQPEEDTPRLVYADWLDENGQPERAEFIRLQIELAGPHDPHGERYWDGQLSAGPESYLKRKALRDCEREMLLAHTREWFRDAVPGGRISHWSPHDPMPYWVLPGGNHFVNVAVARGFICGVELPLVAFMGDGIPCHFCAEGSPDWETGIVECRQCDSTGILCEPLTDDLFALHPITNVVLEDRRPHQSPGSTYFSWWSRPDDARVVDHAHHLPRSLFRRLKGGEHLGPGEKTRERHAPDSWSYNRNYKTATEAINDLSQACVEHGREVAFPSDRCPSCNGAGEIGEPGGALTCDECGGAGYIDPDAEGGP